VYAEPSREVLIVRITAIVLAAALLATVVVATACHGTPSDKTSPTPGGTTSYSNDKYGFSFEIADRFEQKDDPLRGQANPADFDVVFRDPDGAKAGGKTVDFFYVAVYHFDRKITPDLLAKKKSGIEATFRKARSQHQNLVWETPTEASINGLPGWAVDYTQTVNGTVVKARSYLLYKGDKEYQLILQSAESTWPQNEPDLQAAAESFTVQ
jgi:hypothetical protein